MYPLQSHVKEWRWRALSFLLLVIAANAVVSFLHAKLYPSHCTRASHVPLHIQQQSLELLESPRQLYLHVDTPLLPLADKDIVVRSAYLNPGGDSKHDNSTIILIEVRKTLVEQGAFEGCGVGPHGSTKFEVVSIDSESCNSKHMFTHTQAVLYCYDLPVRHLDRAWVGYSKTIRGESVSFIARAEQPLALNRAGRDRGSVVVCAAMLPHYTPFLEDWIRYQKTIGVDHVHLTLESIFLNRGRFDEQFLQKSAEEGYISVGFWHRWLNDTDICDHSLDLALYDCALRFQGTHSHIVLGDPRDFFVPHDPAVPPNLPSFLSRFCPTSHCQFEWRDLFYRHCESARGDGNVTAAVSAAAVTRRTEFFTVYKSELLSHGSGEAGMHRVTGGSVTAVPAKMGYYAHLLRHGNASNIRILPEHERCL